MYFPASTLELLIAILHQHFHKIKEGKVKLKNLACKKEWNFLLLVKKNSCLKNCKNQLISKQRKLTFSSGQKWQLPRSNGKWTTGSAQVLRVLNRIFVSSIYLLQFLIYTQNIFVVFYSLQRYHSQNHFHTITTKKLGQRKN